MVTRVCHSGWCCKEKHPEPIEEIKPPYPLQIPEELALNIATPTPYRPPTTDVGCQVSTSTSDPSPGFAMVDRELLETPITPATPSPGFWEEAAKAKPPGSGFVVQRHLLHQQPRGV